MRYVLRFAVVLLLLSSCNKYKAKYPYSLSDFNPELRKQLEKIIVNGGMCDESIYDISDSIGKNASQSDLQRLVSCEHPILRALGFKILCQKGDSSINEILLSHLDDTAIITYCRGEFGEETDFVSDYFLYKSERKTTILKSSLIDDIITKHPYLFHAYDFLGQINDSTEKYYSIIKEMANKDNQWKNRDEIALHALSAYKRKSDIPFIAKQLYYGWRHFEYPFSIIVNNPDSNYFKSLEKYFRFISKEQTREALQSTFDQGWYKLGIKFDSFIDALVLYKNKRSEAMISEILKRNLYPVDLSSGNDDKSYRLKIYSLLKENECPEYKSLISLLKPEALAYEKEQARKTFYPVEDVVDSSFVKTHDDKYW